MSNFIFCLLKFLAILRDYYSSVIKFQLPYLDKLQDIEFIP